MNITIDNRLVEVTENMTIMDAASSVGISIPTLCYLKNVNSIGACRVCLVEVEGMSSLATACNTFVEDGMVIQTNTPKVRYARRMNVGLALSEHDCNCPTCIRSGNCSLQTLANNLGILDYPFEKKVAKKKWNNDLPLIRDESKCIKCMRCIQVCDKIQGIGIWDIVGGGKRITIGVEEGKLLGESGCTLCGQCITHCPVGALYERDDTTIAFEALADPDVVTVVQIAPAVRVAWGESLGLTKEEASAERMVAALKKLGFDYVFDTNFTADLTIMEEGSEFIERLTHKEEYSWPMFTSCCPGWVRFIKSEYEDMVPQLSTAKSPQQMFGAIAKSYFADTLDIDPSKIFCVSIMPCTAKKHECAIPVFKDACGDPDVDIVLTTREMDRMLKAEYIDISAMPEEEFDSPLGEGTGAAVIFGTQAGVMEAALRSAYFIVTGDNPDADAFKEVRNRDNKWIEAVFDVSGIPVRVAAASGLGNARELLEGIRKGAYKYDFVEIMACPGGCAGGGGQPICDGKELGWARGEELYKLDKNASVRFSHENKSVQELYKKFLNEPLSETSHHLLHTDHKAWSVDELTYKNPSKNSIER